LICGVPHAGKPGANTGPAAATEACPAKVDKASPSSDKGTAKGRGKLLGCVKNTPLPGKAIKAFIQHIGMASGIEADNNENNLKRKRNKMELKEMMDLLSHLGCKLYIEADDVVANGGPEFHVGNCAIKGHACLSVRSLSDQTKHWSLMPGPKAQGLSKEDVDMLAAAVQNACSNAAPVFLYTQDPLPGVFANNFKEVQPNEALLHLQPDGSVIQVEFQYIQGSMSEKGVVVNKGKRCGCVLWCLAVGGVLWCRPSPATRESRGLVIEVRRWQ
jgi:hypothetical protein